MSFHGHFWGCRLWSVCWIAVLQLSGPKMTDSDYKHARINSKRSVYPLVFGWAAGSWTGLTEPSVCPAWSRTPPGVLTRMVLDSDRPPPGAAASFHRSPLTSQRQKSNILQRTFVIWIKIWARFRQLLMLFSTIGPSVLLMQAETNLMWRGHCLPTRVLSVFLKHCSPSPPLWAANSEITDWNHKQKSNNIWDDIFKMLLRSPQQALRFTWSRQTENKTFLL